MNWLRSLFGPRPRFKPLLLHPALRTPDRDWMAGTSWLGGRPRLGSKPWPRNPHDNDPLHFVAQIDCAALAQMEVAPGLPTTGALAFFVESDLNSKIRNNVPPNVTANVLYVPDPATETDVPQDTPPIYGVDWSYSAPWAANADSAPRTFSRYPLDIVPTDVDFDAPQADTWTAIAGRVSAPLKNAPMHRDMLNWGMVAMMVNDFARCNESLVKHRQQQHSTDAAKADRDRAANDFATSVEAAFIAAWKDKAASKDPTLPLSNDDRAAWDLDLFTLTQAMRDFESRDDAFGASATHAKFVHKTLDPSKPHLRSYVDFDEPMRVMFAHMLAGDDATYNAVPEAIRTFMATPVHEKPTQFRPRFSHMFGKPTHIQSAEDNFPNHILLLQLASSGPFIWGDMGYIKYWITPKDLAAGRFENARASFEGH